MIDSYGGKSLHEQSHGESFIALLKNRFGPNGLYILDEPEAALSPKRQLALLAKMDELIRLGSQFIVATHSPIVMSLSNSLIYQLSEQGIEAVRYEETDHVQLTRRFLADPQTFLEMLLAPQPRYRE